MRDEEYVGLLLIGFGFGMILGAFMTNEWALVTLFSGTLLLGMLASFIGVVLLQPTKGKR